METKILSQEQIADAARIIKSGGLVVMPTETVYGLGADAFNKQAVANIFKAKGRPMDNPLIVHIGAIKDLKRIVSDIPEKALILARAFWPGPLTMVLPKAQCVPDEVSAGLDTVAVRYPSHPIAETLILLSGTLIAAPSANLSGSPSPTELKHVVDDMNGRVDAILDGGSCEVGLESTVISLVGDVPRLLRPGGVTVDEIESVIGKIELDPAVTEKLREGEKAASPGMKYKHYAPQARVVVVKGSDEQYIRYVNSQDKKGIGAICFDEDAEKLNVPFFSLGPKDDQAAQAKNLFSVLRSVDEAGIALAYARCPRLDGVGLAVYNRLIRAAGFEVTCLA